jgi:hypothetical protein
MTYDDLLLIYTEAGGSPEKGFQAVFDAGRTAALPVLNEDLIAILGRPNFACRGVAEALRAAGQDIPQKSEQEQAATLHYLLGFYLRYGAMWYVHAREDLERISKAAGATAQESDND